MYRQVPILIWLLQDTLYTRPQLSASACTWLSIRHAHALSYVPTLQCGVLSRACRLGLGSGRDLE
jgi:hypothetical protein